VRNVKACDHVCVLCHCAGTIYHTGDSSVSKIVPSQAWRCKRSDCFNGEMRRGEKWMRGINKWQKRPERVTIQKKWLSVKNLAGAFTVINAHLSAALKDEFTVTLLRNFWRNWCLISMRLRDQSLYLRLLFIVEPRLPTSKKRKKKEEGLVVRRYLFFISYFVRLLHSSTVHYSPVVSFYWYLYLSRSENVIRLNRWNRNMTCQ